VGQIAPGAPTNRACGWREERKHDRQWRFLSKGSSALVGLPGTLHLKSPRSGGDQESAFGLDQALVAGRSIAVVDVVGHRSLDRVPVGVVRVVDDEPVIAQKWHSIRFRRLA
jgi:hypothetical protein